MCVFFSSYRMLQRVDRVFGRFRIAKRNETVALESRLLVLDEENCEKRRDASSVGTRDESGLPSIISP